MDTYHAHVSVVGLKFYAFGQATAYLKEGIPLVLRREPLNQHDRNAIEVLVHGEDLNVPGLSGQTLKLGHITASQAEKLAPVLDAGGVVHLVANQDTTKDRDNIAVFKAIAHGDALKGLKGVKYGPLPKHLLPKAAAPKAPKAANRPRIAVWI